MISPLIVSIPEALREKLGPEGARALADLLNEASVQTRGDVIEIATTRYERRQAEENEALCAEIRRLSDELCAEIEASGDRIIRWMFVFWLSEMFVLAAILLVLLAT